MAPSQVLNAMTPIGSQANSETPAPDRTPRRVDEFSIPFAQKTGSPAPSENETFRHWEPY